ncbi:hypothetical protein [Microbacterium sp. 10M-3C3]|jgi:hypothetical protein|uniref:hypothetical protein n=1 Tax=Microbacterium sp. 10M-3C3 TaxID=2483401 RepID=UPI000F640410|nr:hypothetical protein [Microbacterium sp. 10M-3C3]
MGISMSDDDILINGTSTKQVAGVLKGSGLTEAKIGEILGWWYVGAVGNSRPLPFDIATDVQATRTDDVVTYQRAFAHQDWVDGEDRVQASATPEELGFNARFHAIENEFDAIRAQFLRLAAGLVDVRADLFGVVRELESKITAMQNDLFDIKEQLKPATSSPGNLGVLGTVKVGEKNAWVAKLGDDFQLIEFAGATIGGSGIGPKVNPSGLAYRAENVRPEEVIEVVRDLEDLVAIPEVRTVIEQPGATVADLRTVVAGATLSSGVSAASVLATLPADVELKGAEGTIDVIAKHLVSELPDATAAAMKETVIVDDAARGATAVKLGRSSAEVLGLNPAIRGALEGAGIDATVGGLAKTTTAQLAVALGSVGADVSNDILRDVVAKSRVAGLLVGR